MSEKFILSLDQGTTSSRSIIFDHQGNIVSIAQQDFEQIFPEDAWVEHDALEIWSSQLTTIKKVLEKAKITIRDIAGIGITNQRETAVVWNRNIGEPLCNAIVWQDRRTAGYCEELKKKGYANLIRKKTGLVLDAYFSATKVKWILDNVEGARELADQGDLCFGTIDTWLVWQLTKGEVFITDVSNASRTLLFNIHTLRWDDELLELFNIPKTMLPEVRESSEVYGTTDASLLGEAIPIAGIAGDQQAALLGQLCTEKGMVKNTYGTGCFLLMNTGESPIPSHNNLLTTIAWKINGKTTYALEGSVFIGGAAVQWLRDGLEMFQDAKDIEALSDAVSDSQGIVFVPALTGLGAPYWDPYARGAIFGITRATNKAHIARATLEGIAYQIYDIVKAMEEDTKYISKEIRVDGGAAVNNLLLQFQSDIFQLNVIRPQITETTALGAAYLAGLAIGYWNLDELKLQWKMDKKFIPEISKGEAIHSINKWHEAVGRIRTS
ncbi:MAG: glycerol kinase GlpK [Flavobacteriaceae bacterium]|nr:MAG: glycerol kinase GlpK [Flavobacteriaceae bacterium]